MVVEYFPTPLTPIRSDPFRGRTCADQAGLVPIKDGQAPIWPLTGGGRHETEGAGRCQPGPLQRVLRQEHEMGIVGTSRRGCLGDAERAPSPCAAHQ